MKTTTKESTKIKILKTAFSFYKKPCLTHVSLGDIAKKAGISKAAIFKHFRNKEELLTQMEDHFFSVVADFYLDMLNRKPEERRDIYGQIGAPLR